MDLSIIFQLRNKKFWWMDVIFYLAIALLVATVLCYLIFLTKDYFFRQDIAKEELKLQQIGTETQRQHEQNIINYRNKINDFSSLFQNHTFASNVFPFLQSQTMPNVWLKQFSLDEKNSAVQLTGESDDMDSFSRQVAAFESEDNKKYVKNLGTLNSLQGESQKAEFTISLLLNPTIFSYLSDLTKQATSTTQSPIIDQTSSSNDNGLNQGVAQSSDKFITSFHFLMNPGEIIGTVDERNYTVNLDVPYGTDVKNLNPAIVISTGATVSPASDVPQDFTKPVIYTVTAQDGSTQQYTVTVNILPQANKQPTWVSWVTWIIIVVIALIIIAIIALLVLLFLRRRNQQR